MENERLNWKEKNIQIIPSNNSETNRLNEHSSSTVEAAPSSSGLQPTLSDVWPQIFSSINALSAVIQPGINLAFSGILIPQLEVDPNIKNFTKEQASWIASLMAISQPMGALFVGPLMDYLGRRKTCIITTIPIMLGWIIIYFTTSSLWPIYLARILTGFGGGMTTVGLVYTAEISHVQYRPMLLSLNSVNVALGILLTTVLGVYLEWHTAAFCFGIISFISFIFTFFLPESPYWLVNFTDSPIEYTKQQVRYLNRKDWMFEEEWQRVQDAMVKRKDQYKPKTGEEKWFQGAVDKFKVYTEQGCYKPLIILFVLFFLQQTSGTYVVIFYTINIFKSIGSNYGFGIDEYSSTVLLGVLRFVMSLVSAILSKRVGRKPIMIISSLGMALSCVASAVLLQLNGIKTVNFGGNNSTNINNSTIDVSFHGDQQTVSSIWILVSILAFVCAGSIGHMVVPWTLMSELLPTKIRAPGSGIVVCYSSILLFFIIKTFPGVLDHISLPFVFLSYAVMSFTSIFFVIFFLPETFRKNFVQISNYFEKKPISIN